MPSPKQAAIKCAEECVKLANQRFHLTQEIERLNTRVAMLSEALLDELKSPTSQSWQVLHETESDWLANHDKQVHDAAVKFEYDKEYGYWLRDCVASDLRAMKGKPCDEN